MNERPLISVIVPVYNVENYLDRCLTSVVGQTYENLEIISVDDGAVDQSGFMLDEWALRDSRIIVVHQANRGAAGARNTGLQVASGEYIGFSDSDDEASMGMYSALIKALIEQNADISMCRMQKKEYGKVFPTREFPTNAALLVLDREEVFRCLLLNILDSSVCIKLFRTELFFDVRFPENNTNEEFPTLCKLFCKISRTVYLSDILYSYYRRENSVTTTPFCEAQFDKYDNSLEVMDFISEKQSNLRKEARHYLCRQTFYLLKHMNLHSLEKQYSKRVRELRKTLRKNTFHIALSKYISMKERIAYLMLAWTPRLYRIKHIVKG